MRRILFGAATAALVAGLGLTPGPSTATTASSALSALPAPAFGVPRIVDPIHTYGEPDIKVAPNGDVHVSGPQGTGVQRSVWNVSVDGGDSWRAVQGVPMADQSPAIPDKDALGPGGGDTEIAITRGGRVFFNDLWALLCFTAAYSDDRGKTVQSNPVGCSHPPGDRQWMALVDPAPSDNSTAPYYVAHKNDAGGYKPLQYDVYDDVASGDQLDMSTDGLTFTSAGHYADDATHALVNGNIVVDQPTGAVLGVVGVDAPDPKFGLALAVGTPAANGTQTFAYKDITKNISGDPQTLFPVLTQDAARNLYVVWATGGNPCPQDADPLPDFCFHVYYSYASAADGWSTWSPPRQVDQAPALSNGFPWIAAGADGIVDIVWYGADQRVHPSQQKNQKWDVFMSQITAANTSSPSMAQVKVTPHPMHDNDICLEGTGCIAQQGNRNLADFFQVTIDGQGRARVVYPDTSNGLLQVAGAPQQADHPGAPLVTVATQTAGVNAWTGAALTAGESTAPVSGITDPVGDALWKPLGGSTALPGLDIKAADVSLVGDVLHLRVTTEGDSIGSSAAAANALFGQLVVRWQMGDTLYYAAVEQPAVGGALSWYAGASGSVDLCSVSACDPHYLTYPAPPAGGVAATGTTTATHSTVYDIALPASAVGGVKSTSALQQVMAFSTVSATPAEVPLTNAQADADIVPVQVEGTRTFNWTPAVSAVVSSGSGAGDAASSGSSRQLPATGRSDRRWLALSGVLLVLALAGRSVSGSRGRAGGAAPRRR